MVNQSGEVETDNKAQGLTWFGERLSQLQPGEVKRHIRSNRYNRTMALCGPYTAGHDRELAADSAGCWG
jgi:hypothetical protein